MDYYWEAPAADSLPVWLFICSPPASTQSPAPSRSEIEVTHCFAALFPDLSNHSHLPHTVCFLLLSYLSGMYLMVFRSPHCTRGLLAHQSKFSLEVLWIWMLSFVDTVAYLLMHLVCLHRPMEYHFLFKVSAGKYFWILDAQGFHNTQITT